jgi:hypothetical protein
MFVFQFFKLEVASTYEFEVKACNYAGCATK